MMLLRSALRSRWVCRAARSCLPRHTNWLTTTRIAAPTRLTLPVPAVATRSFAKRRPEKMGQRRRAMRARNRERAETPFRGMPMQAENEFGPVREQFLRLERSALLWGYRDWERLFSSGVDRTSKADMLYLTQLVHAQGAGTRKVWRAQFRRIMSSGMHEDPLFVLRVLEYWRVNLGGQLEAARAFLNDLLQQSLDSMVTEEAAVGGRDVHGSPVQSRLKGELSWNTLRSDNPCVQAAQSLGVMAMMHQRLFGPSLITEAVETPGEHAILHVAVPSKLGAAIGQSMEHGHTVHLTSEMLAWPHRSQRGHFTLIPVSDFLNWYDEHMVAMLPREEAALLAVRPFKTRFHMGCSVPWLQATVLASDRELFVGALRNLIIKKSRLSQPNLTFLSNILEIFVQQQLPIMAARTYRWLASDDGAVVRRILKECNLDYDAQDWRKHVLTRRGVSAAIASGFRSRDYGVSLEAMRCPVEVPGMFSNLSVEDPDLLAGFGPSKSGAWRLHDAYVRGLGEAGLAPMAEYLFVEDLCQQLLDYQVFPQARGEDPELPVVDSPQAALESLRSLTGWPWLDVPWKDMRVVQTALESSAVGGSAGMWGSSAPADTAPARNLEHARAENVRELLQLPLYRTRDVLVDAEDPRWLNVLLQAAVRSGDTDRTALYASALFDKQHAVQDSDRVDAFLQQFVDACGAVVHRDHAHVGPLLRDLPDQATDDWVQGGHTSDPSLSSEDRSFYFPGLALGQRGQVDLLSHSLAHVVRESPLEPNVLSYGLAVSGFTQGAMDTAERLIRATRQVVIETAPGMGSVMRHFEYCGVAPWFGKTSTSYTAPRNAVNTDKRKRRHQVGRSGWNAWETCGDSQRMSPLSPLFQAGETYRTPTRHYLWNRNWYHNAKRLDTMNEGGGNPEHATNAETASSGLHSAFLYPYFNAAVARGNALRRLRQQLGEECARRPGHSERDGRTLFFGPDTPLATGNSVLQPLESSVVREVRLNDPETLIGSLARLDEMLVGMERACSVLRRAHQDIDTSVNKLFFVRKAHQEVMSSLCVTAEVVSHIRHFLTRMCFDPNARNVGDLLACAPQTVPGVQAEGEDVSQALSAEQARELMATLTSLEAQLLSCAVEKYEYAAKNGLKHTSNTFPGLVSRMCVQAGLKEQAGRALLAMYDFTPQQPDPRASRAFNVHSRNQRRNARRQTTGDVAKDPISRLVNRFAVLDEDNYVFFPRMYNEVGVATLTAVDVLPDAPTADFNTNTDTAGTGGDEELGDEAASGRVIGAFRSPFVSWLERGEGESQGELAAAVGEAFPLLSSSSFGSVGDGVSSSGGGQSQGEHKDPLSSRCAQYVEQCGLGDGTGEAGPLWLTNQFHALVQRNNPYCSGEFSGRANTRRHNANHEGFRGYYVYRLMDQAVQSLDELHASSRDEEGPGPVRSQLQNIFHDKADYHHRAIRANLDRRVRHVLRSGGADALKECMQWVDKVSQVYAVEPAPGTLAHICYYTISAGRAAELSEILQTACSRLRHGADVQSIQSKPAERRRAELGEWFEEEVLPALWDALQHTDSSGQPSDMDDDMYWDFYAQFPPILPSRQIWSLDDESVRDAEQLPKPSGTMWCQLVHPVVFGVLPALAHGGHSDAFEQVVESVARNGYSQFGKHPMIQHLRDNVLTQK